MHPAAGSESAVIFGLSAMWVATVLFVGTYAVIMTDKVNRAIIALLGAGLLILVGVLDQKEAMASVDFNTLGLLLGMMLIVNITRRSGLFQYVAIWSAKKVDARPWGIMLMMSIVTAVFSAFLDNVTTVLLTVPVTLLITDELEVKPYPFLFAQIFASNIGGTATLIGDPPNIMIGSATGLTFNDFGLALSPVIIVIMAATLVPLYFIWGRGMVAKEENRLRVMSFDESKAITDPRLLKQSLTVIALVILGFMLQRQTKVEPATVAIFGAALLLLLDNYGKPSEEQSKNVHGALSEAEWITLMFFLGLFVLVYGVQKAGLIDLLAEGLLKATGGDFKITALAILWASAVLSAFIDNIPFVATMIPLIKAMAPTFGGDAALLPLWWALSLGACLGGNGCAEGYSGVLCQECLAGYARTGIAGCSACPEQWRSWLALMWVVVIAVFLTLMSGGLFGMVPVETARWGGFPLTVMLSTLSLLIAFPLAVLVALGRQSRMSGIRTICVVYVELIRGVPLISVLFMASFMLPLFMPQGSTIDVLVRVLIGMTLFTAAYLAEVVRGGLQALPKGQVEAAQSLGLGYWQTTLLVVLPQALRLVVPATMNTFIGAFKDTSLVTIVSLYDLTGALQLALGDADWRKFFFEGQLFVAGIYFVFCYAMSRYSQWIERHLNTGTRRQ